MAAVTTAVAVGVGTTVGVAGAIEGRKAAKEQEKLIKAETDEALRLKENEIQGFMAEQTTAFAKAGVLLEGTPLEVLEATRQEGNRQLDAIARTGRAQASLAQTQGRTAVLQGIGSVAQGAAGITGNMVRQTG